MMLWLVLLLMLDARLLQLQPFGKKLCRIVVVIPELRFAESRYGNNAWKEIITKLQPDSGYFKVYEGNDPAKGLILNFIAYETNNELL